MGTKIKAKSQRKDLSLVKRAYVDSSAFIAFLDKSDSYHFLFARNFADPPKLITSTLVVSETHAWFLKRYDQRRAIEFLNFLEELSVLRVCDSTTEIVYSGIRLIRKFSDQSLTLVDATGLALMQLEKIDVCWSTDRHLGLTRVPLLIDL